MTQVVSPSSTNSKNRPASAARRLGQSGVMASRMGPGPWLAELSQLQIALPGNIDPKAGQRTSFVRECGTWAPFFIFIFPGSSRHCWVVSRKQENSERFFLGAYFGTCPLGSFGLDLVLLAPFVRRTWTTFTTLCFKLWLLSLLYCPAPEKDLPVLWQALSVTKIVLHDVVVCRCLFCHMLET